MTTSAFQPDPHFSSGVQSQRRILSLVIDFNDGTREILEFADDNRAFYRKLGVIAQVGPRVTDQHYRHEIWWSENHVPNGDI